MAINPGAPNYCFPVCLCFLLPQGVVYMEMVTNILQRLIKSSRTTVVRYDIHYSLGSSANNLIGRAAHIAVLDSEIFLEKFICVSCAKYFR